MQQPPDIHTHYGHRERQATRCGHWMHPSAPYRTPLCPSCITYRVNGTRDAALGALMVAGGPEPPEDERNQQWRIAKMRYDVSVQRQSRNRVLNQLREEREQAWEDTHQQFSSQWSQEIILPHDFVECPACASMTGNPERTVRIQLPRDITWWEQTDQRVIDPTLAANAPRRSGRGHQRPQEARGSPFIRELIQDSRLNMVGGYSETRLRDEWVLRRKFNIDSSFDFAPDFWDRRFPESEFRRIYREAKQKESYAAYRARGCRPRPIPPRSSLSQCELSESIEIDQNELEQMKRMEQAEALGRKAWKVGEQVGYLYFVGDHFDGLFDWRDDFLRSNRQMIYRATARMMSEPDTSSEEADSSDDEETDEEHETGEDMEVDE